jgi:uncharacterized membrane protein YccF (DUF307 family)
MSPLSLILNLLWIVFGGLWMAAGWLLAAVIMAVTIIGLPWARAALTMAGYTLLPFGNTVVSRSSGIGAGPLGLLGNIIWLILVFHRALPDLQRIKFLLLCGRVVGTEVDILFGAVKPDF